MKTLRFTLCAVFSFALLLSSSWSIGAPKLPKNYLQVPITNQSTSYSCGAASVSAVLQYWKIEPGPEADLFSDLKTTPEDGTHPVPMANYFKKIGFSAEVLENQSIQKLKDLFAKRETVIVMYQAWREIPEGTKPGSWKNDWDDGHYSVMVAIDDQYIYLMDPSLPSGYGYIELNEFQERWHDSDYVDSDLKGNVRPFYGTLIHIKGKDALKKFPGTLERIL